MMQFPPLAITRPLVQVVVPALTNGPVIVIAGVLRVMEAPVLLVSVIFVAALVTPTAVVANVIVLGLRETLLVPVPLSPISCGLEGSVSAIVTAPRFAPVDLGLKVTLMVQLAPPARVLPEAGQVLVEIVKSVVLVNVIPFMVMAVVPVFFTVTDLAALVVFTN